MTTFFGSPFFSSLLGDSASVHRGRIDNAAWAFHLFWSWEKPWKMRKWKKLWVCIGKSWEHGEHFLCSQWMEWGAQFSDMAAVVSMICKHPSWSKVLGHSNWVMISVESVV